MSRRHPDPEPEPTATDASASPRVESLTPVDGATTSSGESTSVVTSDSPTHDSGASAGPAPATGQAAKPTAPKQTLAGRVWVFLAVAALLLVLVIIFIAENTKSITISFLGAHGHISEALALLLAVVVGIVICLLVGSARILQLSLEVRKQKRAVRKLS